MPDTQKPGYRNWNQFVCELPDFKLLNEIGRGGSGMVFRARQVSLERDVALKVLLTKDREQQVWQEERFEREAHALAALSHPGIVQLYDFGQSVSGIHYLVMEYVEGLDLSMLMEKRGALMPDQAVGYTIQLCEALEHAHKQGVFHRDLKPANVLITQEGIMKITDFGLAKMRIAGEGDAPRSTMLAGTPDYLPPEAFTGEVVSDRLADTYALGVMLYQMLTGSLPRGAFRTPSAWVKGLHRQLDGTVMRAIAERPQDRFQSAAEFQARMMRCWTEGVIKSPLITQKSPTSRAKKDRRHDRPPLRGALRLGSEWWIVIAMVALSAVALVWVSGKTRKSPPSSSTSESLKFDSESGTTLPNIPAASRKIVVDASRDGGVWWGDAPPTSAGLDSAKPHPGSRIADFLRSSGWMVDEIKQGDDVAERLVGAALVIRANFRGKIYSRQEVSAYDDYVRTGGNVLLVQGFVPDNKAENDAVALKFGIVFSKFARSRSPPIIRWVDNPITAGLSLKAYPAQSVVAESPVSTVPLAYLYNDQMVMGMFRHDKGKVIFLSTLVPLFTAHQPLFSRILEELQRKN